MYTYHIKVKSTDNGNKYFISNYNENTYIEAPSLQIESNKTITFVIADDSVQNHPLYISTSNDKGSNKILNDSNAGIIGNGIKLKGEILTLTIPPGSSLVDSTLYYVCGNHLGMGNSISVTNHKIKMELKYNNRTGCILINEC